VERLAIALLLALLAAGAGFALRRRRPDPPSTPAATVPAQLSRADFAEPDVAWIIVVFTSATCLSCLSVWHRIRALESPGIVVQQVEAKAAADLHRRYGIDSVPLTLAADGQGVVRASILGPVAETDLATLSELVSS
jgi:hypothetical protein